MPILYAGTIVLSAFLLFQVQPIIGKMVLPWFGGSAAAWTICMLFFQFTLLLGYLYSHLTSRYLPPRRQAWLHAGLLLAAALTLPIMPSDSWKPSTGSDPAFLLLGLLAATIGLPYFVLSTTGPLVQHWFAQERPGSVPYRLFALSNFASLLGLLSYPLLFEPRFTVKEMSIFWSAGFGLFALFCAALALSGRGRSAMPHTLREDGIAGKPTLRDSLLWCGLAAVPTVVLMAATSHLTANIAPVPMLWVLPLVIYLLTFILCFESARWYRRWLFLPLMALLTPLLIACTTFPSLMPRGIVWPTLLFSTSIFTFCMACHGELARLKPQPAQLTGYYLVIATGGAIGGIFTGLLAPRMFNDDYELTLSCIAAVCIVGAACHHRPAEPMKRGARVKAAVFFTTLVGVLWGANAIWPAIPTIKARNFYGTVKIKDTEPGPSQVRQLTHGTIVHGRQFLEAQKRRWPTSYYGNNSGAGIAIAASRNGAAQHVGVIGLGAGTMAAYCRPGDVYRFYEINPLVLDFAESYFSFLRDCPARKDIALGDARLVLDAEAPQQFDVLAVDAFSGDSVPVHLLTTEAFNIYFRHLKRDGVLAIHISNRYLDMAPVVRRAAETFHRTAFLSQNKSDPVRGTTAATWVLIGQRDKLLQYAGLHELPPAPDVRPWTDDYSSLLEIMK
ncbi:spermidine synthase [Pseudoduganella sp. R-32]|uniref:spermidine synthase n=1 Tax=Pseudoduganella sp. R-32 TaxID=3404061 RepID=UPI003CFAA437